MASASKLEANFLLLKRHNGGRLNLVAIGRTGDGKSSTLNSILTLSDTNVVRFEVSSGPHSVTKGYDDREANIFGINCRLIDTMGLFDTEITLERRQIASVFDTHDITDTNKVVLCELAKVVQLCSDGIDAFLFVINGVIRFTAECRQTLESILKYFGPDALSHSIFILTHKDIATKNGSMEVTKEQIKSYLVGKGYSSPRDEQFVTFDNETVPTRTDQVVELFTSVELMLKMSGGRPYLNSAFMEAQRELERQKATLMEEKQRQLEALISQKATAMEQQWEADKVEMNRQLRAKEEEIKRLAVEQSAERQSALLQMEKLQNQIQLGKVEFELQLERMRNSAVNESMMQMNQRIREMEMVASQRSNSNIFEKLFDKLTKVVCAVM